MNDIKGNFCEVAPEWAADVRWSMDWLRIWYAQRMHYRQHEGIGLVNLSDVYVISSKLERTWVCANQGGAACIQQALQRGELSVLADDESLAAHGLSPDGRVVDEALFNESFTLDDDISGCYYALFDAPVVLINTEALKHNQAEGLPLYVKDTLIHELTHGLELGRDEQVAAHIVKQEDEYLDAGEEVYARLNQVRAHFELKPFEQVSLEDIKSMRESVQKQKWEYMTKLSELDKDRSYKRGELDPEIFKALPKIMIFDRVLSRYSDEQLQRLFNETARVPEREGLDEEHALALDREPAKGNDAQLGLGFAPRVVLDQGLGAARGGSVRRV